MRNLVRSILVILVLSQSGLANAMNTYRAGGIVQGEEYNDILKRWVKRDFSIWVGINENGYELVFFQAETGLSPAIVQVQYDEKLRKSTLAAVSKVIKWSAIARKNKADTQKALGCWGDGTTDYCDESGQAYAVGEMGWQFFSTNNGRQTNLIINLIDRSNQFYKASIYFNVEQMKRIRYALTQMPVKMKHAREQRKKQQLFK